ncbi:hypothetical protein [Streptomyces sp. NPDC006527]|uniref:hypothetical protein n=1 Tax=Streptomyces sp. NPDC006527 TaxID=3364749 RepID=UPI0036BFF19C
MLIDRRAAPRSHNRHPIDFHVFVDQIAMSWAGQLDLVHAAADQVRNPSVAARRAAIVAAVQRLFPAAAETPPTTDPADEIP